ncbi:MAG TPA: thiamine phosphate synthase [Candidatus Tectomicrobia bacterium]|nr:thiamine phosphate synthase [Candidatus Tectomicrobia bacterium]
MRLDVDLYVVTDRHQTGGRPLRAVVEAALRGGARVFQLREKDLTPRDLYPLALEMRQLTRAYGAHLLINDRIDIALAVDADGVHLTTVSLPTNIARQILGPDRLIGISTHNLAEAQAAAEGGADFLVFGPVFFTPSKAPYGQPVGLEALRAVRAKVDRPILAIGGITKANLDQVLAAGADGIAVISAVISAADPAAATQELLAALQAKRDMMG